HGHAAEKGHAAAANLQRQPLGVEGCGLVPELVGQRQQCPVPKRLAIELVERRGGCGHAERWMPLAGGERTLDEEGPKRIGRTLGASEQPARPTCETPARRARG